MNLLRLISRFITGVVFIFSGVVKAVDPLGTVNKFHDYFSAFNLNFLKELALPMALILCLAEFISGFAVLTGYRIKQGIWGVMIMMLIFTPLTFILALTNPVSDCGCFGDAIHMTNWQTFFKNIVILPFAIILFAGRNRTDRIGASAAEWVVIAAMAALLLLFSARNLKYLPVIDFSPYKTGVNIPENIIIPEGKPVDEYKTTFICEKDGVRKEFSLEDYPYDDTTWVFVDQVSVLVKKGYQPPITDFFITSYHNEDITDRILNHDGYTMLMISKKIEEAENDHLKKGFNLGQYLKGKGIDFFIVTASAATETDMTNDLMYCSGDETTLKTVVRSNPGYLLLKSGTIVGKWSSANLPENEWFSGDIQGKQIMKLDNRNGITSVLILVLLTIILLIPVTSIIRRTKGKSGDRT